MKRIILFLFQLSLLLILVSSCITEPLPIPMELWLCSINADGTGFRKITQGIGIGGFQDIYMTKDDRIIFYGEKLWISETDTIRPAQITPNDLTLTYLPARLSQSPDGNKLFFAADKNIYQLSYPDYKLTQLTNQSIRWLRNPIVSDLGNYITFSSNGFGYPTKETEYMYWLNLASGESGIIPCPDSISANPYYSETEDYVYYERTRLFRSRLDGSERSIVDKGGIASPYSMFSISKDQRYIAHLYTYDYMRVFDKINEKGIDFHIKTNGWKLFMGVMCQEVNRVFYVSPGYPDKFHVYDLDTGETKELILPQEIVEINYEMIAPTWDGSKVYFYAITRTKRG